MTYLALGDSISIDDYTGVAGGGAASQFSVQVGATVFENRTRDGCTTEGVLQILQDSYPRPDVVTLTVCGNDLLVAVTALGAEGRWRHAVAPILERYDRILDHLGALACPVIVNTVYDPTDGVDERATQFGLPGSIRDPFDIVNEHIRSSSGQRLAVCDLERLFQGHGYWSEEPWIVGYIEPNYTGASQIVNDWMRLYRGM